MSSVALRHVELSAHEATVRATREVVDASGGVTAGLNSRSTFVREQAARYQASSQHLAHHRRHSAALGLCAPQRRLGKAERVARRAARTADARAALQHRAFLHEQEATQERIRAGGTVYYDPARVHAVNPSFGSHRPHQGVIAGAAAQPPVAPAADPVSPAAVTPVPKLSPVRVGSQTNEYQALASKEARKPPKTSKHKRGRGGENPIGFTPDTSEKRRRSEREIRFNPKYTQ